MNMITSPDRVILRDLAAKVCELAHQPVMAERKRLWYGHNALHSQRPMILAFPEGAWSEITPDGILICKDGLARRWEMELRQTIFSFETIGDDNVLEPVFNIPWQISTGGFGVDIPYHHGSDRGSYVWEPPIRDLSADMGRLNYRDPSVDRQATLEMVSMAEEVFDGLLKVRIRGTYWWTCGLTNDAIRLVGLENLMLLMCTDPQGVHALMKWLGEEALHFITWFEREGLLSDSNENDYTGSGGVGYTDELPSGDRVSGAPVRLRDIWGFAESQETVGVGPDMFAEFILPYQMPIVEKFGLNCYGCCEPIDQRFEHIRAIPRLRRISISPWCDQARCAELLGHDYIYSRKPNPTPVCTDFDEEVIRRDLRETLGHAGKLNLEIILKDTHTVRNQPQRFARWVAIAREEVGRFVETGSIV